MAKYDVRSAVTVAKQKQNRNMPRLDIVKRNIAISASKLGSQNMLFLNLLSAFDFAC